MQMISAFSIHFHNLPTLLSISLFPVKIIFCCASFAITRCRLWKRLSTWNKILVLKTDYQFFVVIFFLHNKYNYYSYKPRRGGEGGWDFRLWGIFLLNQRILSQKNNEPLLAMTVTTNTSDRPNISLVHIWKSIKKRFSFAKKKIQLYWSTHA